MPAADLTDTQIALLCDIGEMDPLKTSDVQKRDLTLLVAEDFLTRSHSRPGAEFKLTAKGAEFLGERGAGLNES